MRLHDGMGFRTGLALFALAAIVFAACGDGIASGDIEASQSNERWELRLSIPGEVRAGEMTAVELSLNNVSAETLRADIDCVSWFGLIVFDEKDEAVFNWYDHVIEATYKGVIPECPAFWKELAPGESLEQTVAFRVDEPGEYTVRPQPPSETVGSTSQPVLLSMAVKVRAR